MGTFSYGYTELDYLKKQDEQLGAAINRIGFIEREIIPDLFTALVHSIVGQQISAKAAVTVWNRLQQVCGTITPQSIAEIAVTDIKQCGTSMRKAGYIKGIGEAVMQGQLKIDELPGLSDAEIIKRLSALHGVGVWTAEMLLIFSMQRPDVVSWGDLAIRRGMMNLYGLQALDKAEFARYRQRYSPYGSVASLYLWRLAAETAASE